MQWRARPAELGTDDLDDLDARRRSAVLVWMLRS